MPFHERSEAFETSVEVAGPFMGFVYGLALTQAPFEPLESVHIKLLSLRTVLLLALASAKRMGELHALSVHQACLSFSLDDSKVTLLPNPAFVPKVSDSAYNCSALELRAFYPPPFFSSEERKLHTLCPVRASEVGSNELHLLRYIYLSKYFG